MQAVKIFLVAFGLFATSLAQSATVAMVQYDPDRHYGDYRSNLENLTALATQAADAGASIIVLPEGSAWGYASADRLWCRPGMDTYYGKRCDDVAPVAEPVPGGVTGHHWEAFTAMHQVTVFYAVMEREGDAFYNTLVALGPDGYLGKYRKRSLYYVDEAYAEPGSGSAVISVEGRALGLMICMDANYYEYFEEYRRLGVRDVIATMDWDQSPRGQRAGRVFFRSQALRNGVNLFVSDQATWDSTGFYAADGAERHRAPLAASSPGTDGFVLKSWDD